MDGGAHWSNIKQGVIDDSDVFSMIVDPSRPSVMFLSACSGIYRSDNYGSDFRKVQGIPATARRTRSLRHGPGRIAIRFMPEPRKACTRPRTGENTGPARPIRT